MSGLLVSRPLGAGVGRVTDLQVPMHHPHLVAVQHGLQDLLDAVTAANSRRVSAEAPEGWAGRRRRVLCASGGISSPVGARGKQGITVLPATWERRRWLGGGLWGSLFTLKGQHKACPPL